MKLYGADWKELRSALCDAFPTRREVGRLINDHFGINIDEIVGHDANLLDTADDIIRSFSAKDKIIELVQAAFTERPDAVLIRKLAQKFGLAPHMPESDGLEKILRQANYFIDPEIWFGRFRDTINQVCQIEIKMSSGESGFGSGVLIAPDIVLTNYHVVENVAEPAAFQQQGHGADPSDVIIRFDHKKGAPGYIQPGVEFRLKHDWLVDFSPYAPEDIRPQADWHNSTASGLDYALLQVEGEPGLQNLVIDSAGSAKKQRGWIDPRLCIKNYVPGMGLIIAQYPQGGALKIGIETDAIAGLNSSKNRIQHKTNTEGGSSGAPCFNFNWELIAIHQAGVAPSKSIAGYNIAIPMSAIIADLKEKKKVHSLGLFVQE